MVHGITSLLIAKPDSPWPERTKLINHVLDYAAALLAGSAPLRGPGAAGPSTAGA